MDNSIQFRNLRVDEIKAKVIDPKPTGVRVLLYPAKHAVRDILNDTLGYYWNTAVRHEKLSRGDAATVRLTVKMPDGVWISSEESSDTTQVPYNGGISAVEEDALRKAASKFNIGDELYTMDCRIPADHLFALKQAEDGKWVDFDGLRVADMDIRDKKILGIKFRIFNQGSETFYGLGTLAGETAAPVTAATTPTPQATKSASTGAAKPAEEKKAPIMTMDTVIAVGNSKGMTYRDARGTKTFQSFLDWAANKGPDVSRYRAKSLDPEARRKASVQAAQYSWFFALAKMVEGGMPFADAEKAMGIDVSTEASA